MRVDAARPVELRCTCRGGDGGEYREFAVFVDDTRNATQKLQQNRTNQFFDVAYPIPAELRRGKSRVLVRLQAHPGKWAGDLFGARTLRPAE